MKSKYEIIEESLELVESEYTLIKEGKSEYKSISDYEQYLETVMASVDIADGYSEVVEKMIRMLNALEENDRWMTSLSVLDIPTLESILRICERKSDEHSFKNVDWRRRYNFVNSLLTSKINKLFI